MKHGVKFLGHAVHPMLVVFPLGLLVTACAFDIAAMAANRTEFYAIAYWNIVAGVIGSVGAAVFGWLDWMSIPANTRAKTVGLWHGIGNMVLAALFLLSGWLRYGAADYVPSTLALAFSFGAIILGLFTAWMGGELVERLGIAVHEGAHADAPSSLSGLPADNTGEPGRLAEERGKRRAA